MSQIIKWIESQEVRDYSQFTMDWVEDTIDGFILMEEAGNILPESTIKDAIKYRVENILQVLNPHLLDTGFFKKVLEQCQL